MTSALSTELYGPRAARTTERNLALTMGFANLAAGPLGGYMMCHGSGGVAAHFRFGSRTRYAPLLMGLLLLAAGLLLGKDAVVLLGLIPEAVLGCLLFYSGIDLAMSFKPIPDRQYLFQVLIVAAVTLAVNPAVAFVAGFALDRLIKAGFAKL